MRLILLLVAMFAVQNMAFAKPITKRGDPGRNVTLHEAYNWSGRVCVRALNRETGEPITARYWSIKEFFNKKRGTHTGNVCFDISGLRDELRVGHISGPAIFYVTGDGGVWRSISDQNINDLCRLFGC